MNPIGAIVESVTKNLGLLNAKIDIPPDYAATLGIKVAAPWPIGSAMQVVPSTAFL